MQEFLISSRLQWDILPTCKYCWQSLLDNDDGIYNAGSSDEGWALYFHHPLSWCPRLIFLNFAKACYQGSLLKEKEDANSQTSIQSVYKTRVRQKLSTTLHFNRPAFLIIFHLQKWSPMSLLLLPPSVVQVTTAAVVDVARWWSLVSFINFLAAPHSSITNTETMTHLTLGLRVSVRLIPVTLQALLQELSHKMCQHTNCHLDQCLS